MEASRCLCHFLAAEQTPIDPVRIQYGMLFAQEAGCWSPRPYEFVPYSYGPFSPAIHADLDHLVDIGLVEKTGWQGGSRHGYRAIDAPGIAAERMASSLAPVRSSVQNLGALGLLRELKASYPAYATELIFNVG